LQTMDRLWREHIVAVEYLRQVIGLRSYGQRDPLNEYKTEGFTLFSDMITHMKEAVTSQLMRVEIRMQGNEGELPDESELPPMQAHHIDATTGLDDVGEGMPNFASFANAPTIGATLSIDPKNPETWGKVGRNDDCPCGSGKKYKHCHGAYA
jgi:preprotein translocase subunit SecA